MSPTCLVCPQILLLVSSTTCPRRIQFMSVTLLSVFSGGIHNSDPKVGFFFMHALRLQVFTSLSTMQWRCARTCLQESSFPCQRQPFFFPRFARGAHCHVHKHCIRFLSQLYFFICWPSLASRKCEKVISSLPCRKCSIRDTN